MKPVEKIEQLIKERRYKAGARTYDKALGSFLQAVDEHVEQKSVLTEQKIWRKIVNGRIMKLTTAAVILAGMYVVIHLYGGSFEVATISFAQITENMKQMPWLHAVIEGTGTRLEKGADRLEAWFCFEQRMFITKRANGQVRYQDDLKQIVQEYEPDVNIVTVSRGTPDTLAGMGQSPLDFPKLVIKMFEDAGEKAVQETGKYKGKEVLIFKLSAFLGGMDMKVEMTVDAKKNILLYLNQKAFDKTGKLVIEATGHFDYPEKGPESIYDVGVPRSAEIVRGEKEEEKTAYDKAFEEAISVVDTRESWPEPRGLVVAYWQARNAKNYEEMSVLWPGSATWSQSLEKEEPVEYVFGEAQPTKSEDYIIVPYASKIHFDEHGEYNLKMVLSKRGSSKKRYYIVSGN